MSEKEKFSSSAIPVGDSESLKGPTELHGEGALLRQLKNRHIAMISIGGVIGTGMLFPSKIYLTIENPFYQGLFLGTASALEHGGPVGLLLGYITMGTICYSVMVSACFPNMV